MSITWDSYTPGQLGDAARLHAMQHARGMVERQAGNRLTLPASPTLRVVGLVALLLLVNPMAVLVGIAVAGAVWAIGVE